MRAYRDSLIGYFAFDDGGETVENYMQRNDWGHAGQFIDGASFTNLPAGVINEDSDGDGLPDWWETQNGLDAGSSDGQDGAWGDLITMA